ncbi:MAG: hypothetical protein J6Q15_02440 [Clostridia bacterium]|nr:hypothetical protein [Clostridia bacterium]
MEKEKKTKKPVTTKKIDTAKKVKEPTKVAKSTPVKEKVSKPAKVEKVTLVKPVAEEKMIKSDPVAKVKVEKEHTNKLAFNRELNLLIGLFSLITIITFCFAFQGGEAEILGWEVVLKAGEYSGVFKGLMILYVVSIFIDCILAIRIDTENEIINIVEKALYMFTVIMNFVAVAVLLSLISKIGIGLIIFFIISIISAIVKFSRIYAK